MRKLTMILTAVMFMLGTMAMTASAQTQAPGAASFPAQLQNATPFVKQAACTSASFTAQLKNTTPFVKQAACNGSTGYCGCGPGWISACAPRCCRCVPCY
jgi:hypothetical protein